MAESGPLPALGVRIFPSKAIRYSPASHEGIDGVCRPHRVAVCLRPLLRVHPSMSKSISNPASSPKEKTSEDKQSHAKHGPPQGASRETCESIAFAFVLALLFRTFAAEAFVIPTGSMAPTLLGRNKEVVCPGCKHCYEIGASEEADDAGYVILSQRISQSACPNCRHMHDVKPLNVFKGDRILVNKAAYQFGDPNRWDVIVFRYPEDTQKNYIKRLVGLPNEAIRIERGDVYARKSEQDEYRIVRKQNPDKQKLLQQLVHDDRHPPRELLELGWPESWSAVERTGGEKGVDGWTTDASGWTRNSKSKARHLEVSASEQPRWMRYRHLVPAQTDWDEVANGKPPAQNPRPQLISEYCGYNMYTGGRSSSIDDDRYWVGDLTLNCTVTITSATGKDSHLLLELVEGVRRYRCRIDVPSGQATLTRSDDFPADRDAAPEIELAKANTPIRGPGTYTLRFANVDDRLCLWVNDGILGSGLVPFGDAAEFEAPANRRPQEADLTPVGIAAQGLAVRVSDLHIERDIYYRADSVDNNAGDFGGGDTEVDEHLPLRDLLTKPKAWGELYEEKFRRAEFRQLGPDEFFVMGDNSPRSADSRLWPNRRRAENRHAVDRQALIGKAFFVYWPHGVPFLNGGSGFSIWGHRPVPRFVNPNWDPETQRRERQDIAEEKAEAWKYAEYVAPFYPQWWRWQRIR